MKHSYYLSLLLVSALSFSACDSSSQEEETQNTFSGTTTISGMTTLSKGFVCIDENRDATCSENEKSVQTEEDGKYSLAYEGVLADGTQLIAEDGYNLILRENNLNRFAFTATYSASEKENNINTLTTFISTRVNKGASYKDAKEGIASKYNMTQEQVVSDPISLIEDEEGKIVFLTIHGIEFDVSQKLKEQANKAAKFRAQDSNNSNVVITEEEADEALIDLSFLDFSINEYTYKLEQYFLDLKNYALNYIVDLKDDVLDGCYFDNNCTEDINLPREALNGAWYMVGYHACMEIDPQDNILFATRDTNESFTLYYREYNSDFTLLSSWQEKGLVEIIKNDYFYKKDNPYTYLNISYNEKIAELATDNNSSAKEFGIRKFSSMASCYNLLQRF